MTNKLTLTEQEELFAKDCKLINLKYEHNGYTGDEKWAIITELSVKELWEKYPLVIERYSPFVHLSIAQGEVINDANRNEDKYAKRSSRTLDCYGYDDEMSSQFHKELAIMFDDYKDVKLQGADSFFGNKKEESSEKIQMIKISELSEFEGHPFKIREDKLQEMADSIKQYGVLMPEIVRKKAYGGYEIIAGHTRKAACEIAGLKIIKKDKNTEKTVLKACTSYQIYKVVDDKEELVVQDYMDDGEMKQVDTFTCDESGEIQTVDSIKSGTYHLYETNAANGYHLNSDYIEITINSKADNYESYVDEEDYHHVTITVNFTNEETKGKLNIFKTGEVLTSWDAEKQNFVYEDVKLDGVEFTIYADGDIETQDNQSTDGVRDTWFKDGDTVCVITTGKDVEFNSECGGITGYTMDDDGTIHVSLPLGKYKVVETKTPYGYVYPEKKEWSVEFVWKDGQDEYVLNSTDATDENGTLNIKNAYAAPSVELLKQDADTKETIEGAVFGLYSKNDIFNIKGEKIVEAGALLATYTTDKDGKIYSDMKLPLMSEGYGAEQKEEEKEPAKGKNSLLVMID